VSEKALILVDLQNDFVPGGALGVKDGNAVVPIANDVQRQFDLVIASKDWHPPDHGSFAANHRGRKIGDVIDLHGLQQILWPVHCVQNTPGAEFVLTLQTQRIARVFFKGVDANIDSYSAMFDNGHRRSTGMAEFLRAQRVREVFILGLATDYCVKFTSLDALREGFAVRVIEDGCRGVDLRPGDSRRALEEMRQAGAIMVNSAQL
jgi:nicotinamidase/pyrazinamidase